MNSFKPLYEDSIIPKRSTISSAGYDLHSYEDVVIPPNKTVLVKTGVTIEMQPHNLLFVCSRSGLALKQSVFVLNAPGVVDADYFPNEIGVILHNLGTERFQIKKGDRIAQAVISDYYITSEDVTTMQRTGGFGSTGVQND